MSEIEDNGDSNRLEELKKRLYSRDERLIRKRREAVLHRENLSAPGSWSENTRPVNMSPKLKTRSPIFKKFFILAAVFFLAAAGFTSLRFFTGGNTVSSENIEIAVLGNAFVAGGEELPLKVEITNKNNTGLEFSDLVVEYPKGTGGEKEIIRLPLGAIAASETVSSAVKLILFGPQGSIQDVKITLEYRLENSNAIFTKERSFGVNMSAAPLSLTIDAPTEINSNQEITLNIKTILNTQAPAKNIRLKIEYPTGFRLKETSPDPMVGDNFWNLGDLAPGMEKTISVKGMLMGQDGDERSFRIYSGSQDSRDTSAIGVLYNSVLHTVLIKKPFLESKLTVNDRDQEEYFVKSGSKINVGVSLVNNLPTRVDDVEIRARFFGNALDKSSLQPFSGFYDSLDNVIIWDKNSYPPLASLEPSASENLNFFMSSAPLFGSMSLIENPEIIIEISVKGKQPFDGNVVQEIENIERKTIKINSDFQIIPAVLFSSGPFVNSGPVPPRAEQETTYTVKWSMTNSSNNISDAEVKASLPAYVRWLGITSPTTENISYNESGREVVWKVGLVKKGTGLSEAPREAAFQVSLRPSLSQIGSAPIVLYDSYFRGRDQFTGALIEGKKGSITTNLKNEGGPTSDGRVVQ